MEDINLTQNLRDSVCVVLTAAMSTVGREICQDEAGRVERTVIAMRTVLFGSTLGEQICLICQILVFNMMRGHMISLSP